MTPTSSERPIESCVSRKAAAIHLGIKPQTLAAWACNRRVEIPYVKIGRRVMYRLSDLEAYCARNTVHGQAGGALKWTTHSIRATTAHPAHSPSLLDLVEQHA